MSLITDYSSQDSTAINGLRWSWQSWTTTLTCVKTPGTAGVHASSMLDQHRMEQLAQLNGLRKFARDHAVSEDVAIAVYERELSRLREGARVERFVGICAEKRAKDAIRTRR